MFKDIKEFHDKFGLPASEKPSFLEPEYMKFRIKFLQEEIDEFCDAYINGDLEKAFDALVDLSYVTLGTAFLMGLPWDEGWKLVHEANMLKVRVQQAIDSKRNSKFDVVKPIGWQAPDLKPLVYEKCDICEVHHGDDIVCLNTNSNIGE